MLDSLRGLLLGAVDRLNLSTSPFKRMTRPPDITDLTSLDKKAALFWRDIQDRWLHGPEKEFYWSMKPNDLGDMAIWQGWYVFAASFGRDWKAAALGLNGLELLVRLGGNNRICRGADQRPDLGGEYNVDPSRKHHIDGDYAFIDDCSESSALGLVLGCWSLLYREEVPAPLRERAKALILDFANQVRADGWRLLNQDGSPAKFGDLRPSVSTAPIRIATAAAIAGLAADVSGDKEWVDIHRIIVREHINAITHCETHLLWIHPWYQDLLAYMVLPVLIQCDGGRTGKKDDLCKGLARQWKKNELEANSLYCYMVSHTLGRSAVHASRYDEAKQTLEEFNATKTQTSQPPPGQPVITWGWGKKAKKVTRQPIATWRRPDADFLWQRCPYSPDGGSHAEHNGLDFCAAFNLGRYIGVL